MHENCNMKTLLGNGGEGEGVSGGAISCCVLEIRIRIQFVDYLLTSTSFSIFMASLLPSIAAAM